MSILWDADIIGMPKLSTNDNSIIPWWKRNLPDPELVLLVLCVAGLIVLLMLILVAGYVRAEGFLSITVPPQAVLNVRDGDTFEVFNFAPGGKVAIRVQGVNTPERGQPKFHDAKLFTAQWLAKGPFSVTTFGKHTFERIEAVVSRNGTTLAQELIAMGYGKP